MEHADAPAADPGHGRALAAVVRGASVALLGSLVGGGLGFLFPVVLAHVLGRSDFGLLVLVLNLVVAAAALGTGGADYAAIRAVAATADPGAKRGAMVTPLVLVAAVNSASTAVPK